MREVYTARDSLDARLMKELLETRGIQTVVRGEPLSILGINIPLGRVFPSVWVVRESDFEAARSVVDAFIESQSEGPVNDEPWTCPECGESLEGQFVECWKCGNAR